MHCFQSFTHLLIPHKSLLFQILQFPFDFDHKSVALSSRFSKSPQCFPMRDISPKNPEMLEVLAPMWETWQVYIGTHVRTLTPGYVLYGSTKPSGQHLQSSTLTNIVTNVTNTVAIVGKSEQVDLYRPHADLPYRPDLLVHYYHSSD